jgi:hypothetical protein
MEAAGKILGLRIECVILIACVYTEQTACMCMIVYQVPGLGSKVSVRGRHFNIRPRHKTRNRRRCNKKSIMSTECSIDKAKLVLRNTEFNYDVISESTGISRSQFQAGPWIGYTSSKDLTSIWPLRTGDVRIIVFFLPHLFLSLCYTCFRVSWKDIEYKTQILSCSCKEMNSGAAKKKKSGPNDNDNVC